MKPRNRKIRAGWIAYIRVPGLNNKDVDEPQLRVPIEKSDLSIKYVAVRVASDIPIPLSPSLLFYTVEGGKGLPPTKVHKLHPDEPEGAWIEVIVVKYFDIDKELLERFGRSKGQDYAEIDKLLGEKIDSELSDVGMLIGGQIAVSFDENFPDLRGVAHSYWWSESEPPRIVYGIQVHRYVVPFVYYDRSLGLELLRRIAPTGLDHTNHTKKQRMQLGLAAYWLLTMPSLPAKSSQRFIHYFLALESLSNLFDKCSSKKSKAVDKIEKAVLSCYKEEEEIIEAWKALKEKALNLTLTERFEKLVLKYEKVTVSDDMNTFRELNKIRNNLMHSRIAKIPVRHKGFAVEEKARYLVVKYMRLIYGDMHNKVYGLTTGGLS